MPLRFSGSPAPLNSPVLASDLPPRAQRLLAEEDLAAYKELFSQSELIEDPHRRYWASMGLIEQGLAAASRTAPARLPALFSTVAAGALDVLERDPSEPKLLNYTGILFHELWSLKAARHMFKAAKRLDPQLDQVDRNLAALAARQRMVRGPSHAPQLDPAVPELAARAIALAERAQPASGLTLSLCMIVRDEQEMLPRCLTAVADVVDEIVIVDTGSVDSTVEIARSFGARVIEQEWTGSFAEARNVSFDAATGDWLMYLDADEVLVREDAPLLRLVSSRTWREAFYLSETNYTGDLDDGTAVTHNALRIFRNRPEYRFEGRLHEQIANRLPGYLPERMEYTSIRIEHYGYLGVVRDSREKSRRNIELLRMQQAEGQSSPFLHYNLGSEYAAAGDPQAALREFEASWSLIQQSSDCDRYEFAPALVNRMVKAQRACGLQQAAISRADDGLERFPGFTDLVLEQAFANADLGRTQQACELYERCIEMGDAPRHYTATVGAGSYLPKIYLAELRQAEGDVQQAIALLEQCLTEHPEFIGSVLPYASALLASGVEPDQAISRVERYLPDASPAARFMLGTALYEAGATAAGEGQFRAVLARQPHSTRARVALGESLLAQQRYQEAAATAGQVPTDDSLAIPARRTELFACMLAKEPQAIEASLQSARQSSMSPAELDLFSAWLQISQTGSTEISPTAETVGLLRVILEALLRVHEFESFEALLGLLARAPLSERERRHLMAEMYLRRGFLSSAADEWMAICNQEPDVKALIGLSRIAADQGMLTEAIDFASAALARDPENASAANILSRVKAVADSRQAADEPLGELAEA